jgi:hypothetical protein
MMSARTFYSAVLHAWNECPRHSGCIRTGELLTHASGIEVGVHAVIPGEEAIATLQAGSEAVSARATMRGSYAWVKEPTPKQWVKMRLYLPAGFFS